MVAGGFNGIGIYFRLPFSRDRLGIDLSQLGLVD